MLEQEISVAIANSEGERPLRPGDVVEVRSPAEILATLDDGDALRRMPFMPEMLKHVGKRYTVSRRVDKICDTVTATGSRRLYDWARIQLPPPAASRWQRWLLVRRSRRDGELAYYACSGPASTSLLGLVRVAGTRWAIEMVFPQVAKGRMRAVG